MDNFNQTVDLREKMERRKPAASKKTVGPIEKIYEADGGRADLKTISQPGIFKPNQGLIKTIVLILAVIIIGAAIYGLYFKGRADKNEAKNWYAVKLVNNEIYYGQVADVKADPVVMSKVYYNYDQARLTDGQAKDDKIEAAETANLRLVKRGQETHGPDGTIDIVRAQVLFMEPLKSDSKVLKAILDYEK